MSGAADVESPHLPDSAIEAGILRMLQARERGSSICPSEVARSLAKGQEWRTLMQSVREAAGRLADRGQVLVTQGGVPVDIGAATGPIRIRRPGPITGSARER